jgi:hypothetical protein
VKPTTREAACGDHDAISGAMHLRVQAMSLVDRIIWGCIAATVAMVALWAMR